MIKESLYDWIVIGGGVSGIAISEILCREGKSVLLLEKNQTLASETSKDFHEWVHSGALYTLAPDNLLTLRYLLGATDDIIEFYSTYPRMNLLPTENGIQMSNDGWFNDERIEFRYRSHKLNPIWLSMVSRSISLIDLISKHDWLRRRAGSEYGRSKVKLSHNFNRIFDQIKNTERFYKIQSPDFTMNSRDLLSDILSSSILMGLEVKTGAKVDSLEELDSHVEVGVQGEIFKSKNSVVTSPDAISEFMGVPIKEGFAPMAIVENVPEEEKSFVELDYYINKCINLLKKKDGIGQAGGITLNKEHKVKNYLEYVIQEHKKRNPSIKLIDTYVCIKKELVQKKEERNYLYHINQNSSKIWSVVLGKFTLAFSMAPEFYRRNYFENPSKEVLTREEQSTDASLSKTAWQEIVDIQKE